MEARKDMFELDLQVNALGTAEATDAYTDCSYCNGSATTGMVAGTHKGCPC